jgi:glycosyltransferase involved in cell wall biosynthesis
MKSILHVIVGLNAGGAEQMLGRLVSGDQLEHDFRHTVISLTDLGRIGVKIKALGVPVETLNMKGAVDIPRVLLQLRRIIRQRRPDIVQTWMYHSDLLGGLAAKAAGHRRILWGVRSTHVQYDGTRATVLLRSLCGLLSRWIPEVVICVADASRLAHIDAGYDASRMVVVPNGFELPIGGVDEISRLRQDRRTEFGLPADAILIGAAGRFNPVKGFDTFIKSARHVLDQCPQAWFLLAGRGVDDQNQDLKRSIDEAGLGDRFLLLGERDDLPACFAAMDIFCLSSRSEGFPNVVGEAMSMALPCVVTDVGDAAMVVGDTGVVVPMDDPFAMAAGLLQVATLPPEGRRALGLSARDRIATVFSVAVARARFAQIYRGEALAALGDA